MSNPISVTSFLKNGRHHLVKTIFSFDGSTKVVVVETTKKQYYGFHTEVSVYIDYGRNLLIRDHRTPGVITHYPHITTGSLDVLKTAHEAYLKTFDPTT